VVLATSGFAAPEPIVDRSRPLWTVRIGPLSPSGQASPPPTTVAVVTAYLAGPT